jgi:hydroxymethylpyrimidine/phosphomethylpyrimidine kinase
MNPPALKAVLSIAGSDPGAGAGLQADLRTFDRLGLYGLGVITAITSQNTIGVSGVHPLDAALVKEQLGVLLADIKPRAMKTGMLATAAIAEAVAGGIAEAGGAPLVVDPVLKSTGGGSLAEPELARTIREKLLPLCRVVTPNLSEAAVLAGASVRTLDDAREAAAELVALGAAAACVTGGHLDGDPADVLCDGGRMTVIQGRRAGDAREYHGTGCLFSAALAAFLARGADLETAVRSAHEYVAGGIAAAVAPGHGLRTPWPLRLEPGPGKL